MKPFAVTGAESVAWPSAERWRSLRGQLPKVDSRQIQEALDDPSLLLYTEAEMPPAYQDWGSGLPGIHSPQYNISANDKEPFGNGNREFPWSSPAGLHRAKNVSAVRFLWLPRDEEGGLRPVVYTRKKLSGDASAGYAWWFPVGTVVGEALLLEAPGGKSLPFELRVRVRESGDWGVEVFRPFPTAASLANRIRELRPKWSDEPNLLKLVEHLEGPVELVKKTLADAQPNSRVFEQSMGIDSLPAVGDDDLVAELLTATEFASASGQVWRRDAAGHFAFAPTTEAPFHVIPANYDAGFVEVEKASCARCHTTTNQHVNRFHFGRDWYGRIRGSDGIFSFHPFDPSCISRNGFGIAVAMRKEFVAAGIVAQYDPKTHPHEIYNQARAFSD